jgi:hypothetical protein
MKALVRSRKLTEVERRLAVKLGGTDKVEFDPLDVRKFPGLFGERQCLLRLPKPEVVLGQIS